MGPIDYSVNVESPFEAALQGFRGGFAINKGIQEQQKQYQTDQQLADIRQNGATQDKLHNLMLTNPDYADVAQNVNKQLAARAEAIMKTKKANDFQNEFAGLVQNPNAKYTDYVTLGLKYPEHKTEAADIWKGVDAQQTKNMVMQLTPISALLKSGKEGLANDQLYQLEQAYENSGDKNRAEMVRQGRNLAAADPNAGAWIIDSMIAGAQDVKDVPTAMKTMQDARNEQELQGNKVSTAQANTIKAWNEADESSYKPQQAQANISNISSQIATRAVELGQNQQRIDIDKNKTQLEYGSKQTEKNYALQTQLQGIDNSLSTVDRVLGDPIWNSWGITGVGTPIGALLAKIPGTENSNFDILLETLKSQQFLTAAQQLKGMGALTEKEGEKIQAAIANLNRNQSPESFKKGVEAIRQNLLIGRERLAKQLGGTSETVSNGIAFKNQKGELMHPQYGKVGNARISAIKKQFPQLSDEQITEFLNSGGR